LGESIAVGGACLTAVRFGDGWFEAELSAETLRRTAFRGLKPGDAVNLERALRAGDRLGGHIVQGHVDGVGRLARAVSDGKGWTVTVEAPKELSRYMIEKGSVAVDGISLTIASLRGAAFEVAVIPHTWEMTTLSRRPKGAEVNLEVDLLAKYVERLLQGGKEEGGVSLEFLRKHGYHD
ncbi:MAG: riboflavin synthase, partial [Candidatus Methylomirabilis sp.]|nr:riboflavin synthase [Deltaproteobacteria bacterium]